MSEIEIREIEEDDLERGFLETLDFLRNASSLDKTKAKEILKKFGAKVPNGVPIFSLSEVEEKSKLIKSDKIVLKAQIHAGGRGKAGGIKIVSGVNELKNHAKKMFGKKLVTHQTGPKRDQPHLLQGRERQILRRRTDSQRGSISREHGRLH